MSLTIVIPVSQAGITRLKSSLDSLEFFGGLQKHTLLFSCAPSVVQQVSEEAARMRKVCPSVFVDTLPREPEPVGRFGAFNTIFRDTVELLAKRGNKNPWFWWEEDMTAIAGGWADRLELEYHRAGQPFMGVRRKASEVMRGPKGEPLDAKDPRSQGDYMVAVGLYPPNFKDYSIMYKYPDHNMGTDVNIRHEVNKHLQHTHLIAHHWGTGNYRRENGRIVCDDIKLEPGFPSYAGTVHELAVVVHGDKTGTLSALVLSETPGNVSSMPVTVTYSAENAEVASLKAENEEMRKDIERLQEQWRVKENSYAEEIEKLKEQLSSKPEDPSAAQATSKLDPRNEEIVENNPLPTLDQVRKAVASSPTKRMLGDWAADFKIDKAEFRKLIEAPDSGLIITKPGPPFVKLAA